MDTIDPNQANVEAGRDHPVIDDVLRFLSEVYTMEEYRARCFAVMGKMNHEVILEFSLAIQESIRRQQEMTGEVQE